MGGRPPMRLRSVLPSTSSMAMNSTPSCSPTSWMVARLGCVTGGAGGHPPPRRPLPCRRRRGARQRGSARAPPRPGDRPGPDRAGGQRLRGAQLPQLRPQIGARAGFMIPVDRRPVGHPVGFEKYEDWLPKRNSRRTRRAVRVNRQRVLRSRPWPIRLGYAIPADGSSVALRGGRIYGREGRRRQPSDSLAH